MLLSLVAPGAAANEQNLLFSGTRAPPDGFKIAIIGGGEIILSLLFALVSSSAPIVNQSRPNCFLWT